MNPAIKSFLSKYICTADPQGKFAFGPWPIPANEIFLLTPLTYATVNLKPVLPGHMLVIPRRNVERMKDLSPEELADMYQAVQAVGELVERFFKKEALTVSVQDGKDAGQTVAHVHVHVMPRCPTDFKKNDDVYEAIDEADMNRSSKGPDCENRPPRTHEDMAKEAATMREFGLRLAAADD